MFSLLVNCYLENKFQKKSRLVPPLIRFLNSTGMKSFEISSIFARLDVLNGILNRISQFTINAYILAVYLKEGGGSVFTLIFCCFFYIENFKIIIKKLYNNELKII